MVLAFSLLLLFTSTSIYASAAAAPGGLEAASYDHVLGKTPSVLERLRFMANSRNDVRSQYTLGVIYAGEPEGKEVLHGEVIEVDYSKAIEWYTKAAEQGYAPAQRELGKIYWFGKGAIKLDEDLAVKWLSESSKLEDVGGQMLLATFYKLKGDKQVDPTTAFEFYKLSCQQYRLAADQKHDLGQYCMGVMLERGLGITRDYVEALKYYRLAADQGLDDARRDLVRLEEAHRLENPYKGGIKWCSIQ